MIRPGPDKKESITLVDHCTMAKGLTLWKKQSRNVKLSVNSPKIGKRKETEKIS